ncbi:CD1108 family mobile element protein [uncultured Acetatifactor sp.]|uniref:CD1108 family mobile element protein n=1 Tax=uncultured Acetatifactor sp. TaxID=1671927 RepID=UPI002606EB7A|nr:peptidoglycan DD-metalloendopeptidase family protein [uncultured Acetatifactor sp.]
MAEKKKKQPAEFAKDKNAFTGGSSKKKDVNTHKAKQKQSGAHQPRDADVTSGHDVQKQEQPKTSGHNVQKQENKPEQESFLDNRDSFQGRAGKAEGQKAKLRQKKRRQQVQFQKENSFTGNKEKPDSDHAGSKAPDGFSEEQNTFTEEGGGEQAKETDFKDDYRRRDTYHQSGKKGRYRRRERQDRERIKKSDFRRDFQTKEATFAEADTFTEGAEPEFQGGRKSDRLQRKAEKAGKKTEAARKKLPKKKEYSLERVFDEKTGRAKYVLTAVVKEKPFKQDNPVKRMAGRAGAEFTNFAHGKVAETEKENSGVEGAHKTEQKAEDAYRFVKRHYKGREQRQRGKVAKLEKKQFKKEVNFRYQKFLEENPEMQEKTLKKQLQKRLQKQRIKREYAKAVRTGQAAKNTKEAAVKTANFTTTVAKKLQEMAAKHASLLVTVGACALLLIMIMTSVSSCGAMFSNGMSTTLAGSYMSVPAEIDAADLAFSELEMELQKEIDSIETDYPDYDEYRYSLDAIGHDPFALISYLSAVHTEFTAADVQGEVESLFDEMYELTLNPVTETRTRTVTKTGTRPVIDPVTGEETGEEEEYEYEEEEEYTVTILEVTLTAKDLNLIAAGHMNSEQKEIYALYNETHGLTQQFYTPLNLYWYNYVSSYYGYRINPATGAEQFHRGVDIAVPTGTGVLAAMDGTVTTAAYDSYYGNYIVIEDSNGYCTKYAHMDTLSVSAGQAVKHGDSIGTTGNTGSSTGSHLHIECLYNGEYYNPLFYFEAGEGTLYGEANAPGSGGGNAIPPDSYDDAAVQALMEEAAKYLGYPYVWGGSSPSTSFDCSGFVCWVYTNSGVHNLPRTTAQGIYDQCAPVSAADAKAGDIIFFTGTYNSAGPVSHVGIYCGNGTMIHCGNPISYANINSSYWQSHFYSFGRLN